MSGSEWHFVVLVLFLHPGQSVLIVGRGPACNHSFAGFCRAWYLLSSYLTSPWSHFVKSFRGMPMVSISTSDCPCDAVEILFSVWSLWRFGWETTGFNPSKTKWSWVLGHPGSRDFSSLILKMTVLFQTELLCNLGDLLDLRNRWLCNQAFVQFHVVCHICPFLEQICSQSLMHQSPPN